MNRYPWYVSASYLLYVILWDGGLIVGTGYLVVVQDHSPWWFVLTLIICSCGFKPWQWGSLFDPQLAENIRAEKEREDIRAESEALKP